MKKKHADIDDLLATFSAHIKESYPPAGQFRKNLDSLLLAKKEKFSGAAYELSLEKNIVFLHDWVIGTEAFLEIVLSQINAGGAEIDKMETMLIHIEQRARENTPERHGEIFAGEGSEGFEELVELHQTDSEKYVEKLEFNYFFLMTLRMLMLEFFNVMGTVRAEYIIDRVDAAAPGHVNSHIEMMANFYLGNVVVGEVVEEDIEKSQPKP